MSEPEKENLQFKIGNAVVENFVRELTPDVLETIESEAGYMVTGLAWNRPLVKIFSRLTELNPSENWVKKAQLFWPELFPGDVIGTFKKYFTPHEFEEAVLKTYSQIDEWKDDLGKLYQYSFVLPEIQDKALREECSRRLVEVLSANMSLSRLNNWIVEAVLNLKSVSPKLQRQLIEVFLNKSANRQDFFFYSRQILPLIIQQGGKDTARKIADAVLQNSEQWS